MELQLHKLFEMHFFLNKMCLTEAGTDLLREVYTLVLNCKHGVIY